MLRVVCLCAFELMSTAEFRVGGNAESLSPWHNSIPFVSVNIKLHARFGLF